MPTINYEYYYVFWRRFWAALIDGIVLLLVYLVCGLPIAFVLVIGFYIIHHSADDIVVKKVFEPLLGGFLNLLFFSMKWLYFALFESSKYQATPGKLLCKIKVADMEGRRISFARATGRHFAKYLSSLTCLVGYIMAAFTERCQALHDMIASTVVIKNVILPDDDDAPKTGKIFV